MCRIDVRPATGAVYVRSPRTTTLEFYVRMGNSSCQFGMEEFDGYRKERWGSVGHHRANKGTLARWPARIPVNRTQRAGYRPVECAWVESLLWAPCHAVMLRDDR